MLELLNCLRHDERGVTVIEYAVMAALIIVVLAGVAIPGLTAAISAEMGLIAAAL